MAGTIAALAFLSALPSESAVAWSIAVGLGVFVVGTVSMLVLYHRTGATIGGIGQAIKNLWEAFGKWPF